MSRIGDGCVRWCESMRLIPAAVLCVLLFVLQCTVMDYYMGYYIKMSYLMWIVADVVNAVFIILAIVFAFRAINSPNHESPTSGASIAWMAWLCQSISLAAKVIIILDDSTIGWDEAYFFGPNTFKTTIALSSIVFFLLLMTQHSATLGSDRRRYIENLTGTVIFDILDTVDILEVLFAPEDRKDLWPAIEELILAVATFNLLIPALPLFTLSITKFGEKMLSMKMLYLHRLVLVLMVNFPNLILRMLLWHGMSKGITPFVLKNALLIGLVFFEFYEHKREKFYEHLEEQEAMEKGGPVKGHNGNLSRNNASYEMGDRGSNRVRFDNIDEGFVLQSQVMSFD